MANVPVAKMMAEPTANRPVGVEYHAPKNDPTVGENLKTIQDASTDAATRIYVKAENDMVEAIVLDKLNKYDEWANRTQSLWSRNPGAVTEGYPDGGEFLPTQFTTEEGERNYLIGSVKNDRARAMVSDALAKRSVAFRGNAYTFAATTQRNFVLNTHDKNVEAARNNINLDIGSTASRDRYIAAAEAREIARVGSVSPEARDAIRLSARTYAGDIISQSVVAAANADDAGQAYALFERGSGVLNAAQRTQARHALTDMDERLFVRRKTAEIEDLAEISHHSEGAAFALADLGSILGYDEKTWGDMDMSARVHAADRVLNDNSVRYDDNDAALLATAVGNEMVDEAVEKANAEGKNWVDFLPAEGKAKLSKLRNRAIRISSDMFGEDGYNPTAVMGLVLNDPEVQRVSDQLRDRVVVSTGRTIALKQGYREAKQYAAVSKAKDAISAGEEIPADALREMTLKQRRAVYLIAKGGLVSDGKTYNKYMGNLTALQAVKQADLMSVIRSKTSDEEYATLSDTWALLQTSKADSLISGGATKKLGLKVSDINNAWYGTVNPALNSGISSAQRSELRARYNAYISGRMAAVTNSGKEYTEEILRKDSQAFLTDTPRYVKVSGWFVKDKTVIRMLDLPDEEITSGAKKIASTIYSNMAGYNGLAPAPEQLGYTVRSVLLGSMDDIIDENTIAAVAKAHGGEWDAARAMVKDPDNNPKEVLRQMLILAQED